MKDRKTGMIPLFIKGVLKVLSWIYTGCITIVDLLYRTGRRKEHKVRVPVISVGNITLGGTGKTPFIIFLADNFLARGFKPAVLTRGYGNDENRMLRDELEGVSVFSGQDRVKNALAALENGNNIILLDDGFQHRRIFRDLNILLLDAAYPFGNGFIFPRGILREPISAIKRADMIVLTKTDEIDEYAKEIIIKKIEGIVPGKPVVMTQHNVSYLKDVTGAIYSADSLFLKKVCIFSGIADPDYFGFLVKEKKANIAVRYDYPDHHVYSQRNINIIYKKCIENNIEKIITTSKDFIKIKDLDVSMIEDKLFIMNIAIDIVAGKEKLNAGLNSFNLGKRA